MKDEQWGGEGKMQRKYDQKREERHMEGKKEKLKES